MQSKKLKQLMEDAAACGLQNIRLRDAAFAILNDFIADPRTTYAILFPSDDPSAADTYTKSDTAKTLAKRVKAMKAPQKDTPLPRPQKEKSGAEMSFDENKAAMLNMLKEIDEQKKLPDADIPKLLKIEADIRVKLNDKFDVTTSAEDQLIIVQPKYNHICEHTGRECWLQTKQYAIEQWGLIDPNEKK